MKEKRVVVASLGKTPPSARHGNDLSDLVRYRPYLACTDIKQPLVATDQRNLVDRSNPRLESTRIIALRKEVRDVTGISLHAMLIVTSNILLVADMCHLEERARFIFSMN